MATLADRIIGGAQQSVGETTGSLGQELGQGLKTGAEVALRMEQTKAARQKLEQDKKDTLQQSIGKLTDTLLKGEKIKNPRDRKNFMNNFVRRQRDLMGLGPYFSDETIDFISNSDEHMLKFKSIVSKVQRGEMTFESAMATTQDPELFVDYDLSEHEMQELLDAEKDSLQRDWDKKKFELKETAIEKRAEKSRQEARDKDFKARRFKLADKINTSGIPDVEQSIDEIDKEIPGGIDNWDGKEISGIGASGKTPGGVLTDEGRRMRQLALGLGNKMLKMRSGAQINESEARRILGEMGLELAVGEGGGFFSVFRGFKTDREFINGVKDARKVLEEKRAILEEGAGEDVAADLRSKVAYRQRKRQVKRKAQPLGKRVGKTTAQQFASWAKIEGKQQRFADRVGATIEELKKHFGVR